MGVLREKGSVSFDYVSPLDPGGSSASPYTVEQQVELLEAGADVMEAGYTKERAGHSSYARTAKWLRESASVLRRLAQP